MDFREKKLYHQIHPLKLATDIAVTPVSLYYLWQHRVLPAVIIGFAPPILVSLGMLKWTPDLERLKQSGFGHYVERYMTPAIEAIRLLTLAPMAYGAWNRDPRFIVLGLVLLALAWSNGLVQDIFHSSTTQFAKSNGQSSSTGTEENHIENVADPSFVDIPGVRLAYDMAGRGNPVVFLHGGLLDRRLWDGQFSFFAGSHCAIRYDMRSSGESETKPSTEPFTHHEDFFHLLQALGIERASLVGLSNYAVALDLAIAYPTLVEKLVLVSPGLRGYEFRDPWVGTKFAVMMRALGQQDLNGAVEVFLNMWVDGPYRTPAEVSPLVRERAREMATRAFRLSRLAPNCKGLEPPAAGRLAEVHVPTLVVLGDKDAPDIHAIGQLIHRGVVGSQLVTIPDVGHTLVMEKPNEFNRVVEAFLQS